MEVAPLPICQKESKTFEINQDQKIYKLNIEIENKNILINLSVLSEEYEIILGFEQLKLFHKAFSMLKDCNEFLEYIKVLIENNKLSIKKENGNQISIEIIVEYLYKQNTIKIDLKPKFLNIELNAKDMLKQLSVVNEKLLKIENNYSELKEENTKLNKKILILEECFEMLIQEVIELKNENKSLKEKINNENNQFFLDKEELKINSPIMVQDLINPLFEKKMITINKEEGLSLDYLKSLTNYNEQEQYLGDYLFDKIEQHPIIKRKNLHYKTICKITGMILGIGDIDKIYNIAINNERISSAIIEALSLLEHNNWVDK